MYAICTYESVNNYSECKIQVVFLTISIVLSSFSTSLTWLSSSTCFSSSWTPYIKNKGSHSFTIFWVKCFINYLHYHYYITPQRALSEDLGAYVSFSSVSIWKHIVEMSWANDYKEQYPPKQVWSVGNTAPILTQVLLF